jgi:hypothetical protein
MKKQTFFLFSGALLMLAFGLPTPSAEADPYRDINRLARRIDSQARSIARETRHFRHTPVYRCLVNDTEELRHWACHIRDHARSGYCLIQLQQNVASLGQAYAILEAKFRRVEQLSPTCNNTRRVRRMLNDVQFEIREMVLVLRSLLTPGCAGELWPGNLPTRPRNGWGNGYDYGFWSGPSRGVHPGFAPYQIQRLSSFHGSFRDSSQGSGRGWGPGTLQQSLNELGRQRGPQPNWQQPGFPGSVPGGLDRLSFHF